MIESHKVIIGGQERKLTFGFRELRFIEQETGFRFLTGEPGYVPVDSLTFFLVVLQAGLMRDGAPTREEVEDMLDPLSAAELDRLGEEVQAALEKTVYRDREKSADPPAAPPPSP